MPGKPRFKNVLLFFLLHDTEFVYLISTGKGMDSYKKEENTADKPSVNLNCRKITAIVGYICALSAKCDYFELLND